MKNILNFDVISAKIARNKYKLHSIWREWRAAIIVFAVMKVGTMAVSAFAAYHYWFTRLFPTVQNKIVTISIVILSLTAIEIVTGLFLEKFFKFLFRGKFYTVAPVLIVLIFLYSVSFIGSTNGLAMRQSTKVDATEAITKNNKLEAENIKANYQNQISGIETEITTIKANPVGWSGGKRCILTRDQLENIKHYQNRISKLHELKRTDIKALQETKAQQLKQNNITTTKEAEIYYNIVSGVMIAQIALNGILMFFWSQIFKQNDKDVIQLEQVQEVRKDLNEFIWGIVVEDTKALKSQMQKIYLQQNKQNSTIAIEASDKTETGTENQNKTTTDQTQKQNSEVETKTPVEVPERKIGFTTNDSKKSKKEDTVQYCTDTVQPVDQCKNSDTVQYCKNTVQSINSDLTDKKQVDVTVYLRKNWKVVELITQKYDGKIDLSWSEISTKCDISESKLYYIKRIVDNQNKK